MTSRRKNYDQTHRNNKALHQSKLKEDRTCLQLSSTFANTTNHTHKTIGSISKLQKIPKVINKLQKNINQLKRYYGELSEEKSFQKKSKIHESKNKTYQTLEQTVQIDKLKDTYATTFGKQTNNLLELYHFYKTYIQKNNQSVSFSYSNRSTSIVQNSKYDQQKSKTPNKTLTNINLEDETSGEDEEEFRSSYQKKSSINITNLLNERKQCLNANENEHAKAKKNKQLRIQVQDFIISEQKNELNNQKVGHFRFQYEDLKQKGKQIFEENLSRHIEQYLSEKNIQSLEKTRQKIVNLSEFNTDQAQTKRSNVDKRLVTQQPVKSQQNKEKEDQVQKLKNIRRQRIKQYELNNIKHEIPTKKLENLTKITKKQDILQLQKKQITNQLWPQKQSSHLKISEKKIQDQKAKQKDMFEQIFKKNMYVNKIKQDINQKLRKQEKANVHSKEIAMLDQAILIEESPKKQGDPKRMINQDLPLSKQDISLLDKLAFINNMIYTDQMNLPNNKQNLLIQGLKIVNKKKGFLKSKFYVDEIPRISKTKKPHIIEISPEKLKSSKQQSVLHGLDISIGNDIKEDSFLKGIDEISLDL